MAKEKQNRKGLMNKVRGLAKEIIDLNDNSRKLINDVAGNDTSTRDEEMKRFMEEADSIISNDFKRLTSTNTGDLGSFIHKLMKENEGLGVGRNDNKGSIEDMFENEGSGIYQQFLMNSQNNLNFMEEVDLVTTQFNELNEAIYVTRDSVFNSDDHTSTLSRDLTFRGKSDERDLENHLNTVYGIEKEYKLQSKLKEHVGPSTLKFGKYFVYVAPYSYIFDRYNKKIKQDEASNGKGTVKESLTVALESASDRFIDDFMNTGEVLVPDFNKKMSAKEKDGVLTAANSFLSAIRVDNEHLTIPVLENFSEVGAYMEAFNATKTKSKKDKAITDGVVVSDGVKEMGNGGKLKDDFSDVNGVYMKLIDPRKVVPVKVLGMTIGYYYIHERAAERSRSMFSSNFRMELVNQSTKKEEDFIRILSERVVKSFDRPFLEENVHFKESIATALQNCDIYNKDIKFQFIPKDHMVEFKVNVDTEGDGRTMIHGSIFYAKLYLTLLFFNMHSIVTKSNDQRLFYVANSGIDKDIASQIQKVTREMKARQINYSDLMNYHTMLAKVGMGKDAFIPTGKGDVKALSFDTLAGQQVDLYSDFMNNLRTGAINNTGVPSVIMDYVNQADYSRSIVMGNLRHLIRCISYQGSFNEAITELYQKILVFGNYMPSEVAELLEFKLAKPKTLDSVNFADLLNNAKSIEEFVTTITFGENADLGDVENKAKDILSKMLMREHIQMLNWSQIEEFKEEAMLRAVEEIEQAKLRSANAGGEG